MLPHWRYVNLDEFSTAFALSQSVSVVIAKAYVLCCRRGAILHNSIFYKNNLRPLCCFEKYPSVRCYGIECKNSHNVRGKITRGLFVPQVSTNPKTNSLCSWPSAIRFWQETLLIMCCFESSCQNRWRESVLSQRSHHLIHAIVYYNDDARLFQFPNIWLEMVI